MDNTLKRTLKDKIFRYIIIGLSFISVIPLVFILGYILKNGISSITPGFFTHLPKPVGEKGGGISNAIVGTFMIVIIASVISIPVGIISGVFLSENRKSRLAEIVRISTDILQGIPSIVIGIIAYIWVVKSMGGFSALSGGVALAIMMLPVIIKSTEETLNLVPDHLKEASLALGVPYYRTILKVILPAGISGIVTGILLGVARVAGETAPLLFTAFGNPFMNLNVLKPVNSLPLLIFNYVMSPYNDWHKIAWGAALVLIVLILILNIVAKVVIKKWKVQF
ncbi:MAG: phosphate ABC transporter permease PstA [Candidatus Omnitrophica bacterium]|nr:phosphate ABC transporter permease PstA [Candidatus Omnitrophota bacterium]